MERLLVILDFWVFFSSVSSRCTRDIPGRGRKGVRG